MNEDKDKKVLLDGEAASDQNEMAKIRTEMAFERTDLAYERTMLSNTQTLLAYIRTSIAIFAAGVGMFEFVENKTIVLLGVIGMIISPIVLIIGIADYMRSRRKIRTMK